MDITRVRTPKGCQVSILNRPYFLLESPPTIWKQVRPILGGRAERTLYCTYPRLDLLVIDIELRGLMYNGLGVKQLRSTVDCLFQSALRRYTTWTGKGGLLVPASGLRVI